MTQILLSFILLIFLPPKTFGAAQTPIAAFLKSVNLESEFKAHCLKIPTLNSAPQIQVIDFTSRMSQGFHFESVRFHLKKEGVDGQPACLAEREMIQLIEKDSKRSTLVDSGFYPEAYCGDPVRFSHPPIVYQMEELGVEKLKSIRRPLAVIELVSSSLPCPDTNDVKLRRYFFFDLQNLTKPLLEIEADFILPEIGNSPYRIHLVNVSKVHQIAFDRPQGKLPSEIELKNGKFSVGFKSIANKLKSADQPETKNRKGRIRLNSIYSKDQKHVYYETVDGSGQIEGADPKTFQLLNSEGESAYTKDSKRVFFFGKPIPLADAKTFVQMNERYGKDVNHVYHMDSIVSVADVASFVAPFKSAWYAKDKNHVYSGKEILKLADPQTFTTGESRSCGQGCSYRSEDKN